MKTIVVLAEINLSLAAVCVASLIKNRPGQAIEIVSPPVAGLDAYQRLYLIRLNTIRLLELLDYFKQEQPVCLSLDSRPFDADLLKDLNTEDYQGFVPVPEDVLDSAEGYEVALSDVQHHWLEQAEQAQFPFLEQELEAAMALEQRPSFAFLNLESFMQQFQQTLWPELSQESRDFERWWQTHQASYRFVFALQLWQMPGADRLLPFFQSLIQRVGNDPDDLQAHLLLLLFKREYADQSFQFEALPAEFKTCFRHFREQLKGTIKILKPVDELKVTFLVSTYNRQPLLKRTIDCILAQTSQQWEMLIVDGGSKDNTPDYCRELSAKYPQIRYIYEDLPPGFEGIRETSRILIEEAQTELVAFCPDDDYFEPDYLEKMLAQYQKYPWVGMIYSSLGLHELEQAELSGTYGPFLRTAGLINRDLSLQQSAALGLCPQGCLHRKQILMHKAMELMYHKPDRPTYIGWDYIISVYLMAYYDVVHVPERLFHITVSASSSISGQLDTSRGLIFSLEEILRGYTDIFERPFPQVLYERFREIIKYHLNLHFSNALSGTDVADFSDWLEKTSPGWKHFVELESLSAETCSAQALALFQL